MKEIASLIARALRALEDEALRADVAQDVVALTERFPIHDLE
jgi:glycine/serine hydroxymethyltransferase